MTSPDGDDERRRAYQKLDEDPEVQAAIGYLRRTLGPFDPANDPGAAMPTPQEAREQITRVIAAARDTATTE